MRAFEVLRLALLSDNVEFLTQSPREAVLRVVHVGPNLGESSSRFRDFC